MDDCLVELGVTEGLVNRLEGDTEEISAKLLETGTGDGGIEINTLEERVDLNAGLGGG